MGAAALAGNPFHRLVAPGSRGPVMEQVLSARESGIVRGIRFRAAIPGSRNVWFEADCTARKDASGSCTGITGILRDVTDLTGL